MITTLPAHLMPMVEKAAEAIFRWKCGRPPITDERTDMAWLKADREQAAAALIAFLNACLEGGVAREAQGEKTTQDFWDGSTDWTASKRRFPALILSLGEAK